MEANASTWNKLFDIYVNKSDKKTLMYLVCSENPDIITNFLDICISRNSIISHFDYYVIYFAITKKHANNNVVIDYILTNLTKIIARYFNCILLIANTYRFLYLFIINLLIFCRNYSENKAFNINLIMLLNNIIDNVYSKEKLVKVNFIILNFTFLFTYI